MAPIEDSRPFMVLKQKSDDFIAGFNDDVKSCSQLLESKLSDLISGSDIAKTPPKDGNILSVDVQFSRAKYDIFVHMKALLEDMEGSWKEQLEDLKDSFLENVEILLAKTKLETKLSLNESKKTPKNRRSSAANASSPFSSYSLFMKAKQLPVLNSLLPQTNEEDDVEENGYSVMDSAPKKSSPQLRRSLCFSPESGKTTPPKKSPQIIEDLTSHIVDQEEEDEEEEEEEEAPVVIPPRNSRTNKRTVVAQKQTPVKRQSSVLLTPQNKSGAKGPRGRKSILKADSLAESELHATPSRSTRKRTAVKDTTTGNSNEMEHEETDFEALPTPAKNVHFSGGLNIEDDLEIYSPDVNLTRSAPRRKTVVAEVTDNSADVSLTPNIVRSRSKRKTIGNLMDNVSVAPSPKRFRASKDSKKVIVEESEDLELLGNEESSDADHYTPWLPLDDLDGKVPAQPGIYELKVYKAKKSAYIGSCDNLRQKLTLHKVGQASGHKHLDKYLERNRKDVQVRYEKIPTPAQAKNEEMKRIKSFVEQHKTTPAYN